LSLRQLVQPGCQKTFSGSVIRVSVRGRLASVSRSLIAGHPPLRERKSHSAGRGVFSRRMLAVHPNADIATRCIKSATSPYADANDLVSR
jgi:hypothetical protein